MTEPLRGVPLGRYLLGEKIASGGMGEVRLAVQLGLGRFQKPIALKLLLSHLTEDPMAVEMFLNEARLASRMNHPNVVQIFDVGVEGDRYYIAMELVRGVAMSTLIKALAKAQRSLASTVLEYVGRALCEGLHHAHEQLDAEGKPLGLVHRDVTPHNVLLSVAGEVKLTDFGIAKARDSSTFTQAGTLKGKLGYAAPEQVLGEAVTRAADIFGAGVTLFQLATLTPAFRRNTDEASLRAIREDPLPNLAFLRPDLPEGFVAAIRRATEKEPGARFATALEFRDAIAPESSSQSATLLGATVAELCKESVEHLEQKTRYTMQLTSPSTPEDRTELADEGSPRKRGRLPLLAGFTLLGAGIAAGWYVSRTTEATEPAAVQPPPREASPSEPVRPPALAPLPPAPARPAEPEETQPAAPVKVARPAAKKPERRSTYLYVDADPWGTVYLDGQKIGDTPIAGFPVHGDEITVKLENSETGRSAVRRVKTTPGKPIRLRFNLQ